jgi:hypothetical protein
MKKTIGLMLASACFAFGAPVWTAKMSISEIDFNSTDNNVVTVTLLDNNGNQFGPVKYWYDCPAAYAQCYNNTSEKAGKILSILLTAQTSGQKVKFFGEQSGSHIYFKGVSISP